jgi:rRNA maturation RNase YbeY
MIRISVINAHPRRRLRAQSYQWVVTHVLRLEGVRRADVSVVLAGDTIIRRLNGRWLGHKGTTDVISFPFGESETVEGEVYVNLDRAERQAREYDVGFAEEVLRLIVHGVLHLAGYHDHRPAAARVMRAREDLLVKRLAGRRGTR